MPSICAEGLSRSPVQALQTKQLTPARRHVLSFVPTRPRPSVPRCWDRHIPFVTLQSGGVSGPGGRNPATPPAPAETRDRGAVTRSSLTDDPTSARLSSVNCQW